MSRGHHPARRHRCTGQQTTLGVMGGGQLGRMFVHAAQRMGYFTAVLDPDRHQPGRAGQPPPHPDRLHRTRAGPGAADAARAAITTEFENVPAPALAHAGAQPRRWRPAAAAVAIAQDRAAGKAHFVRCGVPCAPYARD